MLVRMNHQAIDFADRFVAEAGIRRSRTDRTAGSGIEPPTWRQADLSDDLLSYLAGLGTGAEHGSRSEDAAFESWEGLWFPVDEAMVTALASGFRR